MKNETKTRRVLIALDYDPTAQKVAEVGYNMAKAMNAEVVLLHVMANQVHYTSAEYSSIMGFTGYMDMGPLDRGEGLKKTLQHFLDKSKHHLGDKDITTLLKEGDSANAILETAKNVHADIIVMGSHGRRWLEEILVGSVTEKVLHHTTVPLFIIPTRKKKN